MSKRKRMYNVLKLQSLGEESSYSARGVSTIGSVSPTSIQLCKSPLPSSVTSVGFCNNG
ncbi:hypothetical protein [Staphylococcus xylosus]|uniref:hypothetical protein n=1 Tax=Staphylococcus xylosus TaxID=1288 RepID=UPI003F57C980